VWRNKLTRNPWGRLVLLTALAILLIACTTQGQTPTPGPLPTPIADVLYVDPDQWLNEISPLMFGTNYGPWSFVPLALMPQAVEAGFSYLRFPGGNWGDENDITELQLDNFIILCQQLGAEPSVSVRLRGGTREAAAALVHYANIEQEYGIKYWSIGNEPELFGDYDTERYNQEWREIAQAMLTVDPNIVFVGPDVSQYSGNVFQDPRDDKMKFWVDEFLRANGDIVDIVSVHRYPFPRSLISGPALIQDLQANSAEWDEIIPNLRALIRAQTGRDLPVAVTEFNSHWDSAFRGEATPDSHYNAIWLADVIARLMRQDVEIAAQFALQSSSDNGGWGLFSRTVARPSYYVYRMFQQFGNQLVYASSGVENVSVYASLAEDGMLSIMVINMDIVEKQVPLSLDGALGGLAEIWLFDESHAAEQMETIQVESGGLVNLPARSITVYKFSKN
jgi:hypothetical protein